jgi:hypothetical protein
VLCDVSLSSLSFSLLVCEWLSTMQVVFEGVVEIVNLGKEPKTVQAGTYTDTKIDLSDAEV